MMTEQSSQRGDERGPPRGSIRPRTRGAGRAPRYISTSGLLPTLRKQHGLLRAAKILEWMNVVGVLAATRHCAHPVVTASVDGMELVTPMRVGEHVTLKASVAHTSDHRVGVGIEMRHGHPDESARARPNVEAYMTFVALDDVGRPARVPRFVPETPAEMVRFREGELRREFRRKLAHGAEPLALGTEEFGGAAGRDALLRVRDWLKVFPRLRMPWERVGPRSRGARTSTRSSPYARAS
jgi:acyl-CoA hydrolase